MSISGFDVAKMAGGSLLCSAFAGGAVGVLGATVYASALTARKVDKLQAQMDEFTRQNTTCLQAPPLFSSFRSI